MLVSVTERTGRLASARPSAREARHPASVPRGGGGPLGTGRTSGHSARRGGRQRAGTMLKAAGVPVGLGRRRDGGVLGHRDRLRLLSGVSRGGARSDRGVAVRVEGERRAAEGGRRKAGCVLWVVGCGLCDAGCRMRDAEGGWRAWQAVSVTPAGVEDGEPGVTPPEPPSRASAPRQGCRRLNLFAHVMAEALKDDQASRTLAGVCCLACELPGVLPPAKILHPSGVAATISRAWSSSLLLLTPEGCRTLAGGNTPNCRQRHAPRQGAGSMDADRSRERV